MGRAAANIGGERGVNSLHWEQNGDDKMAQPEKRESYIGATIMCLLDLPFTDDVTNNTPTVPTLPLPPSHRYHRRYMTAHSFIPSVSITSSNLHATDKIQELTQQHFFWGQYIPYTCGVTIRTSQDLVRNHCT